MKKIIFLLTFFALAVPSFATDITEGLYLNITNYNTDVGNEIAYTYYTTEYFYDYVCDFKYKITKAYSLAEAPGEVTLTSFWYGPNSNALTTGVEVVIPSEVSNGNGGTYKVTAIDNGESNVFSQTCVTSITIPYGIVTIGNRAFAGTGITELVIPDTVITLGNDICVGCIYLETVVIGEGVESMGYQDFKECTSLKIFIIKATTAPTYAIDGNSNGEEFDDDSNVQFYYPSSSDTYTDEWFANVTQSGTISNYGTIEGFLENYGGYYCVARTDGGSGCDDSYYSSLPTSISEIGDAAEILEVARYNIAGQKINGPQKGINIVVYSDGSIKKLIEK